MRYYNCVLKTNVEEINNNTKIKLRDYDYDSTLGAVNAYFCKHLDNDFYFFTYREESNAVLASFCYDEKKTSYQEAFEYFKFVLKDAFCITGMIGGPCEVTMFEYLENIQEAKRRGCGMHISRYVEDMNLWFYRSYYDGNMNVQNGYVFNEKIISETPKPEKSIYDKGFLDELSNIDTCKNASNYTGNMVHYVISSRSTEAAQDIAETLMQHLYKANRICNRRMEIISEISPYLYKRDNHIEETIENNYGGVIVFDLSEKFGNDPTEYGMTAKYIENLVKKYRNQCLFVFTYNMDHPGFAYSLLPQLKNYVIPVMLREGTGNRKAAVTYMKELIEHSEYSEYANEANEFMKQFSGNEFTQTDVIMAYNQFEAWCLNKNVLQGQNYFVSDDFMLDRDENVESAYEKLGKMIGLDIVKKKIDSIIAENIVEKERKKRRGRDYQSSTMHMIFSGNPGTAKTTVAKLFAGIAKEKGIIKSGIFVELGGNDCDTFGGVYALKKAFQAAKGGVLFIDEAYAIKSPVAITVLLQEMENHRDEVIVILAGYNDGMHAFLNLNEGLKSRIPHWVDFPDYNADELTEIFKFMIEQRGFSVDTDAVKEAHYILDKVKNIENFGNGRYVRNLIDEAVQKQSVRLLCEKKNVEDISKRELFRIKKADLEELKDDEQKERENYSAKKELDDMIGLSKVKQVINKAIASHKLKKLCMEKGMEKGNASMHMVFTGNPGTAKTTVARLFAEIMKDENILSTGNFVEVGRADLVGSFVGHTAPLVKKRFREAQGGVLFIDEAYSLCDDYEKGYGAEAISTIVQEMENHRDDVIVIFAGYPAPMDEFLKKNPGMLSRIAFQLEFEDYTTDELCDITKLMLEKKKMTITDSAMEKLKNIYEAARKSSDYGNGRFVRKMLEEAEMNLAERLMQLNEKELTTELLSTLEERDIPDPDLKKEHSKNPFGFCA